MDVLTDKNLARDGQQTGQARKLSLRVVAVFAALPFLLCGCVNQYPQGRGAKVTTGHERVVATSRATVQILDCLNVDIIGVPKSELQASEVHRGARNVGASMEPDMEIIRSLTPDWVFAPRTLEASLGPRFEAARVDVAFLNLRSVQGMYTSIAELGPLLDRQAEVDELLAEYERAKLRLAAETGQSLDASGSVEASAGAGAPTVLILMGLPGSYLVATENSYVGSLVKLAGGVNVYAGQKAEFIAANTEDMLQRKPDIILRAAHALPDDVVEMFDKEFRTNDIWKHFAAVETGRVYDLPYDQFGMSATFAWPEAIETLKPILYP